MSNATARLISLYLPQFHPIPENDAWWGRGFTEWTNTAKARPMFKGHYQPHLPADLGFYDLRLPETRAAQAELARSYGIEAFCYYHYWFAGRRLIERPFNEVLSSGEPDFPFCLCWANQSWTGIWHGAPNRVLVEQTYPGLEDHRAHFQVLLAAFRDRRYVTVDGKPLFVVYNPSDLPDSLRVTDLWRELALEAGLTGLFLVAEASRRDWDPKAHGFDATLAVHLPPRRQRQPTHNPLKAIRWRYADWRGLPTVHDYDDFVRELISPGVPGIESFPCLIPNWDNTPRSGANGLVLHGSTPEAFRRHVRRALERVSAPTPEHRLIFVKSWNEWAEGNHLEPDLKFGLQYLEAIRDELARQDAS
jgi:lipopolysaccharide biosynthesis protein